MIAGDIAVCSRGEVGLVTSSVKEKVTYQDGSTALAWVGIHLTAARGHKIGDPWSSRVTRVIGNIDQFVADRLCHDWKFSLDHLPEGSH